MVEEEKEVLESKIDSSVVLLPAEVIARADADTCYQQVHARFLRCGLHILLHGPGGSGKTHLVKRLLSDIVTNTANYRAGLEVVRLAWSGVAAEAIGGQTVFSWLCGSLKKITPQAITCRSNRRLCDEILSSDSTTARLRLVRMIWIDEIGNISAKMFQLLDSVLKRVKGSADSIGGVQLIMTGDVLQLPTINSCPFFRSTAWQDITHDLAIFNRKLTYGHRFTDLTWATILGELRLGFVSQSGNEILTSRNFASVSDAMTQLRVDFPGCHDFSALVPVNSQRTKFIKFEYDNAPVDDRQCFLSVTTPGTPTRALKQFPTPHELYLVRGARVAYTGNNKFRKSHHIANGTEGVLIAWTSSTITVNFTTSIGPVSMDLDRYNTTITVDGTRYSRLQYPLQMIIARTMHNVQGVTLDQPVVIVFDRSFEDSQLYVAVSRARHPSLIYAVKYDPAMFHVKLTCFSFDQWCEENECPLIDFTPPVDDRDFPIIPPVRLLTTTFAYASIPPTVDDYSLLPDQTLDPMASSDSHHQLIMRMIPSRQSTRSEPFLLGRKTIYYDLETFFNGKEEEPYYNYMIMTKSHVSDKYFKHVPTPTVETVEFCALCKPTLRGNIMRETVRWILTRVIDERDQLLKSSTSAGRVSSQRYFRQPFYLCAYNGAGFDFHFFLREVLYLLPEMAGPERFFLQPTLKGSYIVTMSIYDLETNSVALVLHDICQITMCSLDAAAREYLGDKELAKGIFPHAWVTENHEQFLSMQEMDRSMELTATDFPPGAHRDKFLAMVESGDLNPSDFRIHEQLHKYGPLDVDILKALYEKVDQLCLDELGVCVLRFPTVAAYTWYGAMKYCEEKYTITPEPEDNPEMVENDRKSNYKRFNIYRFPLKLNEMTNGCIVGGKCYPRATQWQSRDHGKPYDQIKDCYYYADICSMYPWAMVNHDLPMGVWKHFDEEDESLENVQALEGATTAYRQLPSLYPDILTDNEGFPLSLLKVTLTLNPHHLEPGIGRHPEGSHDKGLRWDVGVEHTRWITSVDLWIALIEGGSLAQVHAMITFQDRGRPYASWVQRCFDGKAKAQADGDRARRQQYKLAANSCYGATLKRMFPKVTVGVSSQSQLRNFHSDFKYLETVNWRDVLESSRNPEKRFPSVLLLNGERRVNRQHEVCDKPRYQGAFILSWTRVLLRAMLADANPTAADGTFASISEQVLYGDTDSFVFHARAWPRMKKWFGTGQLGELTDDLADNASCDSTSGKLVKITKFYARCPKWYAMYAVRPDDTIKEVAKMASINLKNCVFDYPDGRRTNSLDFGGFEFICNNHTGDDKSKVVITMPGRLLRNGVLTKPGVTTGCFSMGRGDLSRTAFKTTWNGRNVLTHLFDDDDEEEEDYDSDEEKIPPSADRTPTVWSVPHGWKEATDAQPSPDLTDELFVDTTLPCHDEDDSGDMELHLSLSPAQNEAEEEEEEEEQYFTFNIN